MDVFDDPAVGHGDPVDLVRQMVRLGDREEATALLRAYVERGGDSGELPEVAFELRDVSTLRRLALSNDRAGERLAEILIADLGVEAAAAQMAALPEPSVDRLWLHSPRRLQFAIALHRSGRNHLAVVIANEVLASVRLDSRSTTLAKWLLTEAHAALGDLDALRTLADEGSVHAQVVFFRLLGEREDLSELLAYANRGDDRAMYAFIDALYVRGDASALRRQSDAGNRTAALLLPKLLMQRGERDQVVELAEAGNSSAQLALVDQAAGEDDLETLRHFAAHGFIGAAGKVVDGLVRRGDTIALRALADRGDLHARNRLVPLLVRQGDVRQIRELAANVTGDIDEGWAFAWILVKEGMPDEAATVLRTLLPQDLDPGERRILDDLIDRLDLERLQYIRQRTFGVEATGTGAIPFDAVEWIVLAVSAGVLGNAGYAGLVAAVSKLWERNRARHTTTAPPAAEPANPAPEPVRRSEREALSIACLAVHDHCVAIDATVPNFARIQYEALNSGDGRWVFNIREPGGRRFTVRVPPPRHGTDDVVLMMYVTAQGRDARSTRP